MPLECVFNYSGNLKDINNIEVLSLAGTGADGMDYDMMYLMESDDDLTQFIITSILHNHSNWGDEAKWWDNVNRGLIEPS